MTPAPLPLLVLAILLAGCTDPQTAAGPDPHSPASAPAGPKALHAQWTVTPAATVSAAGTDLAPGGEPAIGNCVLTNEIDESRIQSIRVDAAWDGTAGALDLFAWSRDEATTSNQTTGVGSATILLEPRGPSDLTAVGVVADRGVGLPIEVVLDLTILYDGPAPYLRAERCVP